MKAWLETSALVTLHFRCRRVRAGCGEVLAGLPVGTEVVVSRYVVFELARGFLACLGRFHNESYACGQWHEVRNIVKARNRDHTYEGPTWRDALDDMEETLALDASESESENPWQAAGRKPAFFRARLRYLILAGWRQSLDSHEVLNPCGCRADLPSPRENGEGRLTHDLPMTFGNPGHCGAADNCGVLAFVKDHAVVFAAIREKLTASKAKAKKGERERRAEGIAHLLKGESARTFEGVRCHHCGDAMICMEAGQGMVVTKDKDYKGLAKLTGGISVRVPHQV
ncbi:MAG: hypothetical protein V4726_08245 [Verrucomicrobiota bacterium]